jgi:hypothetical protein
MLVDSLIDADEIDRAAADLAEVFPSAEEYQADPEGVTERWLGRPGPVNEAYTWPPDGPGFRPEQHRWSREFPLPGSGALNRLFVHPAIVDFMERALGTRDIRLYQAQVSAKYSGITNYEQPMHTDRNHSWLPTLAESEPLHVEAFLYLSDVFDGNAPTHLVSIRDAVGRPTTAPLFMPRQDPELYAAERAAAGPRGSLLAYGSNVFHRAVDLREAGGARFLMNVSYKVAGRDWIGYHAQQSRANQTDWVAFAERSTPRELELFGFPPPGHGVWTTALLDATADRYPKLDLTPWRAALT